VSLWESVNGDKARHFNHRKLLRLYRQWAPYAIGKRLGVRGYSEMPVDGCGDAFLRCAQSGLVQDDKVGDGPAFGGELQNRSLVGFRRMLAS
jgi:hypothetical protein